jgi:hypothetical protein
MPSAVSTRRFHQIVAPWGDTFMLNPQNQNDKDRLEKLKETQVERGRDEEKAIEVAASEVKELRRREGRSKEKTIPPMSLKQDSPR